MANARPVWEQDPRIQRVLALLAAILAEPGITPEALALEVATRTGRAWSSATLRRDLRLLKDWALLGDAPQRKGYRLSGVHLSVGEGRQVAEALALLGPLWPGTWPSVLSNPEESGHPQGGNGTAALLWGQGEGDLVPMVALLWEAARKGATLSFSSRKGSGVWEGPGVPLRLEWVVSGPWVWVENHLATGPRHQRIAVEDLRAALPTRQPLRGRKRQLQALALLLKELAGLGLQR